MARVLSGLVVLQSMLDLTVVRAIREALAGLGDRSESPSSSERLRLGEALGVTGSTFSESESDAE